MNLTKKWSRTSINAMADKLSQNGGCKELTALAFLDRIIVLQIEVARLQEELNTEKFNTYWRSNDRHTNPKGNEGEGVL